ncbi:Retrotransposon gag protein [Corchorus capsularis]|uniref:Retrotransposon gag protein n=1 Tax=Corchorus capsularis TaxID=210143 RepID=A0A1R3JLD5_COCAP|nr:Retrotransposon gag protein [Corchorus capsularis]
MDPANPHFPPMEQLPQEARRLIFILEDFLQMSYPVVNDNIPAPILGRPIMAEITRLIIAYHFGTTIQSIRTQTGILEWIGLDHDDLPTTKRIVSQLQQPKILKALCDSGLANFRLPILNIDIQNPKTPVVNLQQSEHNFTIQSTDKVAYIFTASNIIQAKIGLRTEFNLILETLSYSVGFHFGRPDNLSELSTASVPFNYPIDVTILYYNVRGANLASFRTHPGSLIVEYEPDILIMTETRMGNLEGHEIGAAIGCNQIVVVNSTNYSGALWLFSNMTAVSIEEILRTRASLTINLLGVQKFSDMRERQIALLTDLFHANFSNVPRVCATLEDNKQGVNAVGLQGAYQRKPEPYWRPEQPSQQYGNQGNFQGRPNFQRPNFQTSQAIELQQIKEAMEMMRKQISQLASDLSDLKTQGQQRIPSQPKVPPREDVSAISLRSGKELQDPYPNLTAHQQEEGEPNYTKEDKLQVPAEIKIEDEPNNKGAAPIEDSNKHDAVIQPKGKGVCDFIKPKTDSNLIPFQSRLKKSKKEDDDQDILEIFRKVEVNIPLLDAIQQILNYAKFLKQLCTNKKRLQGKVSAGANVFAVLQKSLPPKCKDPADGSLVYPKGVLENILIKVEHLIFPIDIFIMDMEYSKDQCPLLLGRPFLKTSHTKIDVFNGSLTMEFDGEVIHPRISSQVPLKSNNFVYVISSKFVKKGAIEDSSSTKPDRISKGRQRIMDIRQLYNETFHQFWRRFKQLCVDCPDHGFKEEILIQFFYGGLGLKDRVLVDSFNESSTSHEKRDRAKETKKEPEVNNKEVQPPLKIDQPSNSTKKHDIDLEHRAKVASILQRKVENFPQFWQRFKKLCAAHPHHGYDQRRLVQIFYQGLRASDRLSVDTLIYIPLFDHNTADIYEIMENFAQMITNTSKEAAQGLSPVKPVPHKPVCPAATWPSTSHGRPTPAKASQACATSNLAAPNPATPEPHVRTPPADAVPPARSSQATAAPSVPPAQPCSALSASSAHLPMSCHAMSALAVPPARSVPVMQASCRDTTAPCPALSAHHARPLPSHPRTIPSHYEPLPRHPKSQPYHRRTL